MTRPGPTRILLWDSWSWTEGQKTHFFLLGTIGVHGSREKLICSRREWSCYSEKQRQSARGPDGIHFFLWVVSRNTLFVSSSMSQDISKCPKLLWVEVFVICNPNILTTPHYCSFYSSLTYFPSLSIPLKSRLKVFTSSLLRKGANFLWKIRDLPESINPTFNIKRHIKYWE